MSYLKIDRPIYIGKVINFTGDIHLTYACGIQASREDYSILWMNGECSSYYDIEFTTVPKSFISRFGLGLIRYEKNQFSVYAVTGKMLFADKYDLYKKELMKIRFTTFTFDFTGVFTNYLYLDQISSLDEKILFALGFFKIENEKFKGKLYHQFYPRLIKSIKDNFGNDGFISPYYSNFIAKAYKKFDGVEIPITKIGVSDDHLRSRILYVFESEWLLWESQFVNSSSIN